MEEKQHSGKCWFGFNSNVPDHWLHVGYYGLVVRPTWYSRCRVVDLAIYLSATFYPFRFRKSTFWGSWAGKILQGLMHIYKYACVWAPFLGFTDAMHIPSFVWVPNSVNTTFQTNSKRFVKFILNWMSPLLLMHVHLSCRPTPIYLPNGSSTALRGGCGHTCFVIWPL